MPARLIQKDASACGNIKRILAPGHRDFEYLINTGKRVSVKAVLLISEDNASRKAQCFRKERARAFSRFKRVDRVSLFLLFPDKRMQRLTFLDVQIINNAHSRLEYLRVLRAGGDAGKIHRLGAETLGAPHNGAAVKRRANIIENTGAGKRPPRGEAVVTAAHKKMLLPHGQFRAFGNVVPEGIQRGKDRLLFRAVIEHTQNARKRALPARHGGAVTPAGTEPIKKDEDTRKRRARGTRRALRFVLRLALRPHFPYGTQGALRFTLWTDLVTARDAAVLACAPRSKRALHGTARGTAILACTPRKKRALHGTARGTAILACTPRNKRALHGTARGTAVLACDYLLNSTDLPRQTAELFARALSAKFLLFTLHGFKVILAAGASARLNSQSVSERRFFVAYIFGPVRSRRLGASLGIDLMPHKTCNLDCVYCECGATTHTTTARSAWVPIDDVLAEIVSWLDAHSHEYADSISLTFAGGGEPTLHSEFGKLARRLKERCPEARLTLITNGLLFTDPEVRRDAAVFDLVMPSLDAATQAAFERINRPPEGCVIEEIIEGLAAFRREYAGTIWLEIFIVPGINDQAKELALLREAALRIAPDRVQINSLDRTAADPSVPRASFEDLEAVMSALALGNAEIISRAAAK